MKKILVVIIYLLLSNNIISQNSEQQDSTILFGGKDRNEEVVLYYTDEHKGISADTNLIKYVLVKLTVHVRDTNAIIDTIFNGLALENEKYKIYIEDEGIIIGNNIPNYTIDYINEIKRKIRDRLKTYRIKVYFKKKTESFDFLTLCIYHTY